MTKIFALLAAIAVFTPAAYATVAQAALIVA